MRLAGGFRCVNGSKSMKSWKKNYRRQIATSWVILIPWGKGIYIFKKPLGDFVTRQGWLPGTRTAEAAVRAPVLPAGLTPSANGHRCCTLLQWQSRNHITPFYRWGDWGMSKHRNLHTMDPTASLFLPCITELSFNANLATLGMWYVSQASPATSYKSSSHFCLSETL